MSALHELLQEGSKGPGPKTEALEALSLRPVWLATWEPRAEGFRTLINANGEEALAVFSSEQGLRSAAKQLEWIEEDGSLTTHRAIGGDILRHAWTREYAFVVIDIGSDHVLEFERQELKGILRDLDATGPFRTSRPPPPSPEVSSSFPPPTERKPVVSASTVYSMSPSQTEKLDRLSDMPTKPHEALYDSEPPTEPRAALPERRAPERRRKSSRPAHKPKSEPPGSKIEEISARPSELGDRGTYGAASVIPPSVAPPKDVSSVAADARPSGESVAATTRAPSTAPRLNSDAPTAPAAQPLPTLEPGKLKLPAIGPIGAKGLEPPSPSEPEPQPVGTPPSAPPPPPTKQPPRIVAPSIGDGIKLADLHDPPDEELLSTLAEILRGYFEIEWASFCLVARPAGRPSPAIGLRIDDNYRNNVTTIIKSLCEAARKHGVDIDVLLIDGHDLLRKAREKALVFYPWKPKA